MYSYNLTQWLLFFYCYCFLGWCIESSIVSYSEKRWVNRGFLQGPMLPIYGSGAIMVLVCTLPVKEHVALVYVFGMIGATVLEYITGWAMEKILKVRYWDYSNEFLNLNGHICLKCSLFWGVLSIFMTYVVHMPIEKYILQIPPIVASILAGVITAIFLVDFFQSAKTALDLAKFLEKMQAIRDELDVLAAQVKEETIGNLKERSTEAVEALKERSSEAVGSFMEKSAEAVVNIKEKSSEAIESLKERSASVVERISLSRSDEETLEKTEEASARERMRILQNEKLELLSGLGKGRSRLIRRHPTAISTRFREAFDEVKASAEDKIKGKIQERKDKEK